MFAEATYLVSYCSNQIYLLHFLTIFAHNSRFQVLGRTTSRELQSLWRRIFVDKLDLGCCNQYMRMCAQTKNYYYCHRDRFLSTADDLVAVIFLSILVYILPSMILQIHDVTENEE